MTRLTGWWATWATLSLVVGAVFGSAHSGTTVASSAVAAALAVLVVHVSGGSVIPAGATVAAVAFVERVSDRDTATEQEPGDKHATADDAS